MISVVFADVTSGDYLNIILLYRDIVNLNIVNLLMTREVNKHHTHIFEYHSAHIHTL